MGNVKLARSPQEWGGLWKRERERKPLGGERISIVRCALSPLKEVVARTPVDGSCVTHTVKQIESHTSPQDTGKPVLRIPSTQTIRNRKKANGHSKAEHSCVSGARRKNKTRHKQTVTERQRAQKREPFGSRHTSYVRRISSAISRLGSRISIACRSMYL